MGVDGKFFPPKLTQAMLLARPRLKNCINPCRYAFSRSKCAIYGHPNLAPGVTAATFASTLPHLGSAFCASVAIMARLLPDHM